MDGTAKSKETQCRKVHDVLNTYMLIPSHDTTSRGVWAMPTPFSKLTGQHKGVCMCPKPETLHMHVGAPN